MSENDGSPRRSHVLTGFLGSGKTTLLNRLLRDPKLADSAVLINEIGAVSIDHHLVERMEPGDGLDIMVLQGGCTCCAVRGDLVAALRELLCAPRGRNACRRSAASCWKPPGSPIPAPILFRLVGDPVLRHKFAAGAVIATVDALHGRAQLARFAECRKQVALADRLVITKTDLADSGAIVGTMRGAAALESGRRMIDAPTAIDRAACGPPLALATCAVSPARRKS